MNGRISIHWPAGPQPGFDERVVWGDHFQKGYLMSELQEGLRGRVRVLAEEIGSRSLSEPEKLEETGLFVESEFESAGLLVLRQSYEAFGVQTANVVARTPDWTGAGPVMVLGAHYDTVPGTPGADDNASAVAVMIETAGIMAREAPGKTANLLFVAFSTEEPPAFATGCMGSRIFVERMVGSDIRLAGALVLEMVGFFSDEPGSQCVPLGLEYLGFPDKGNFIALVGDRQSADLAQWACDGFKRSGADLPTYRFVEPAARTPVSDLIRLSDNVSFWDAGIPALMVTDTAFLRNDNYHKATDTAETLDYRAMERLVVSLVHTLTGNIQRGGKEG